MSLRYFYEEMVELHVVGAGSLLEFSLNSQNFRMPVGRVQYLYLTPLSFGEFLDAINENALRKYTLHQENLLKIPDSLHEKLNNLLRKYFILGGMPAVVKEYIQTEDILKCQKIQQNLVQTFIDDFAKYSKISKHKYLEKVFYSIPNMLGSKYMYSKVDTDTKSRDLKHAVELLEKAGIVNKVRKSGGGGIPLESTVNNDFYKLIFLDIGLVHSISGLYSETAMQDNLTSIYKGAVTEQYVGQEIITHTPFDIKPKLFYWVREARNSNAEIDYLTETKDGLLPIEVKSGAKGTLKSLHIFIDKFKTKAVKISQAKYSITEPITNTPLYATENLFCR